MNKYGYFVYEDFAIGAKQAAEYSSSETLQTGAALSQLREGVAPYDYCGLELNDYITATPKKLYKSGALGFLTKRVSDNTGTFDPPVEITINFTGYFSMTGITVTAQNIITSATITAYRDDEQVKTQDFTATDKEYFYDFSVELINELVFSVSKIQEAEHFLSIINIEYGRPRIFDDTTNSQASISSYYSLSGDTLEYDTLDLTIFKDADTDYLFQRKQPLRYVVDGVTQSVFYVEKGEEDTDTTVKISAYDCISNLEDDFYGGIYENKPFNELAAEILKTEPYETEGTDDIRLTGYLKTQSRRNALIMICRASNVRVVKGDKLYLKPISTEPVGEYTEENIIDSPTKTKNQEAKSVKLVQHNYSKGNEEYEVYHWYIARTYDPIITSSYPVYNYKAYEVTGQDENGEDIVSSTESKNVSFVETNANYVKVHCTTNNKVVIKALKYAESTVDYTKTSQYISSTEQYQEVTVDNLTIMSDHTAVLNTLFDVYTRKVSYSMQTLEKPQIGAVYDILGTGNNITKITNTLNGVYEVEGD